MLFCQTWNRMLLLHSVICVSATIANHLCKMVRVHTAHGFEACGAARPAHRRLFLGINLSLVFDDLFFISWCLFLQLASGAFGHIKDTVLSALNREPTMDISPETVGTLSLIMLAQAQEVFFLKATSGTKALTHRRQLYWWCWRNDWTFQCSLIINYLKHRLFFLDLSEYFLKVHDASITALEFCFVAHFVS